MILFVLSLGGIIYMFAKGHKQLIKNVDANLNLASRDISYETFKSLRIRTRNLWLVATHALAIVASRIWARLTHRVGKFGNRVVRKIDERIKKHEKENAEKNRPQSIFLTTIKAYKHEIKKLNGSVSEELPKPRSEVDLSKKDNNI